MKINKLLVCMVLSMASVSSQAVKVDCRDMGITDDDIVKGIKAPKPASISDALDHMKATLKLDDVDEVDLSCNNITARGAVQILEFCSIQLPNLKILTLAGNRIYDLKAEENYGDFEDKLSTLLAKSTFQSIDLRINGIAASSWFDRIAKVFGTASSKINWKNPSQQVEE